MRHGRKDPFADGGVAAYAATPSTTADLGGRASTRSVDARQTAKGGQKDTVYK